MDYQVRRNLDGVYFRVQRNGKWLDVCFTDLTAEEREAMCNGRDADWLKQMLYIISDTFMKMAVATGVYAQGSEADPDAEDDND